MAKKKYGQTEGFMLQTEEATGRTFEVMMKRGNRITSAAPPLKISRRLILGDKQPDLSQSKNNQP